MYFLIEDDKLLDKYIIIWDKVSADIKKEFDSELVYNKEFLKTKIKSHGNEVTDFYYKKFPKWKYIEKKIFRHIHDNLSDFSYSPGESDEQYR